MCPRPRPQVLLQHTVLILVLVLTALKVLVLVLEDRWTVLVPSLISGSGLPTDDWTVFNYFQLRVVTDLSYSVE